MSDNEHVVNFALNYTGAQREAIRFVWNGKHAGEFHDENQGFRWSVAGLILSDFPSSWYAIYCLKTRCGVERRGARQIISRVYYLSCCSGVGVNIWPTSRWQRTPRSTPLGLRIRSQSHRNRLMNSWRKRIFSC